MGSSRIITNATGTVCYDADLYPFGAEQNVYTNTCPQNYKFTGKERDAETGLDEFGARYYASFLGRFVTPDWAAKPTAVPYAKFGDPQTLNLYSYVENSPVNRADADGHADPCSCFPSSQAVNRVANDISDFFSPPSQHPGGQVNRVGPLGPFVTTALQIGIKIWTIFHSNASEQGRDAQGKFLPKEPGQTQPGAEAEKKGLEALGATKNTKPIPGSTRIPDGKTEDGQYAEIKSGGSITNTKQLDEMSQAAKEETGRPLIVGVTNPNATVSKPVQQNPNIEVKKIPQ